MTWETTMPSILGYFATMLYNPNNVAFEASTVTTLLEIIVGDDLCKMLGYYVPTEAEKKAGMMAPWGHITSGGTVANLEGLWSARNLKFYPFTLKEVIATAPKLSAAKEIKIALSNGEQKLLRELGEWELLNLKADDILDIPERLTKEFKIPEDVVKQAIEETEFTLQKMGMRAFAEKFLQTEREQPVFFVPGTKHYSWPKSAAILGIGSNQMRDVGIDIDARMEVKELRTKLEDCLQKHIPVLAVIAVMGSTEESSIDPLADIVALRDEFREKGLEFNIHDIIEEEFRKALSQALLQDSILQVFHNIDSNKDGEIAKSEVDAQLRALGYTDDEVENIWNLSDSNKDGILSYDEFLTNFASFLILK